MIRKLVAVALSLSLIAASCNENAKKPQGKVVSRTCAHKACLWDTYKIKVKWSDGSVTSHNHSNKDSMKCKKDASYPKCLGIKWIGQ